MKNKKIAIIGGSGFIGTRLANRLKSSKIKYIIYDKNKSISKEDYVYFDILDKKSFSKIHGCDTIIHLAAEHRDNVIPLSRYYDVNVQGSINICEVAKKYGINKIIFTSSVAIYGFAPPLTDESGDPNYFNEYGRTKYLAEQVFKKWQMEDQNNRTLVIVRPTVVFGEGNRGNVYNLFKQIASRKFLMIGNGKNIKSMAYVENVAAFLEFSLRLNHGLNIYNYVDKPDFDMNKLVSLVRNKLFGKKNVGLRLPVSFAIIIGFFADIFSKISGKSLSVSSIRIKKFLSITQFETSVKKIKFSPPVNLEQALNRTINYEFIEDNSKKRTYITE